MQARRGGRGEQNKALRHGVLQELLELAFYHTVPPEEQVISESGPSTTRCTLSVCFESSVFASKHNRQNGKILQIIIINICEILASSIENLLRETVGRYCTYGCTHQTPTVEATIAVLGHRTLRGANYHCSYSSIPNTMETHGTKRPQEPKYSRLWPLLNLLGRGHPDPTPHP